MHSSQTLYQGLHVQQCMYIDAEAPNESSLTIMYLEACQVPFGNRIDLALHSIVSDLNWTSLGIVMVTQTQSRLGLLSQYEVSERADIITNHRDAYWKCYWTFFKLDACRDSERLLLLCSIEVSMSTGAVCRIPSRQGILLPFAEEKRIHQYLWSDSFSSLQGVFGFAA